MESGARKVNLATGDRKASRSSALPDRRGNRESGVKRASMVALGPEANLVRQ